MQGVLRGKGAIKRKRRRHKTHHLDVARVVLAGGHRGISAASVPRGHGWICKPGGVKICEHTNQGVAAPGAPANRMHAATARAWWSSLLCFDRI
jgi:hypothetical protein